jgi:glycosyltransferase involved in cell wall biosynthesis
MPDEEWLVDPYQPADMADKMQRMLALSPDRRRELMEKNQKHAREFSWDKTARKMIEIFNGLARVKN